MGVGKCGCVLLKKISKVDNLQDDLFAFKINYEYPENSVPLFNGNISETYWKTASDNLKRKYSYQYDDLNRLLEGNYSREGGNFKNSYLETMNYDKNGNIQTMYRNGDNDDVNYEFTIDNLFYTYDSENKNQLKRVFDASNSPQGFKDDSNGFDDPEDDYEYDANGNLTADANKKIQNITYNHLNLPVHIVFETGEITYLYNAAGQKLQKSVEGSDSITTEYLTGFQYHNEALKHFAHAEGYVSVVNNRFKYVFNYTDHLGNIRLSYSDADDNNTISENEILEENHYYPFGLKHSAYNTQHQGYIRQEELDKFILLQMSKFAGDGSYNYKYNGKEYQDELGLNMYDYRARNYDPAIGRWMNIDPLAETSRRFSPYTYALNNPVYFIDPDGMKADWFDKKAEAIAQATEQKIDNEITSVSQGNASDKKDRLAQLNKSKSDIADMRNDKTTQYKFENASQNNGNPETKRTGSSEVTIYSDSDTSQIHENRHGGQMARGEYDLDLNQILTKGTFGVSKEVDAYQAQFGYDGKIDYRSNLPISSADAMKLLQAGKDPTVSTISKFSEISSKTINTMVDPGGIPIYPPVGIPLKDWNKN